MRAADTIKTASQYIAAVPEERRSAMRTLHQLIRKTVPKLKPFVASGMLGYGPYHYRYASGREGDTALIGLASQKQYMALYACAADEKGYLGDRYRDRLPGANCGKSCIRFKRLEDIDLKVIEELLREAERIGGLGKV